MLQSDPARNNCPPLVLTVAFEPHAQAYFDTLRTRHFPPERNLIPAHLTLFHVLPGGEEESIVQVLRSLKSEPAMPIEITSLMKLGRGVALRVESTALSATHKKLQHQWQPWLTAQDRQGFRPHIVIQNKVDPAIANALYAELSSTFQPFTCTGTGLTLWRYMGGPWEQLETISFDDMNAASH